RSALETEDVDADELRGLREQRAGDAGDSRPDGVYRHELAPHRCSDRRHPALAFADSSEAQPERRANERTRRIEDDEEYGKAVEIRRLAVEAEAEHAEDLLHLDAGEPVDSTGDRRGLIGRL